MEEKEEYKEAFAKWHKERFGYFPDLYIGELSKERFEIWLAGVKFGRVDALKFNVKF